MASAPHRNSILPLRVWHGRLNSNKLRWFGRRVFCRCIRNGDGHDHGQPFPIRGKKFFHGEYGSLWVERIKGGFGKQDVNPSFNQSAYLRQVGFHQLIKGYVSKRRIIDVRRKRSRSVGWANGSRDESRSASDLSSWRGRPLF